MTQIKLTPEQDAALSQSREPVAICRLDGSIVGFVSPSVSVSAPSECPFTPDEIAAAEKEAAGPGPFRTTRQIFESLQRRHSA
jgi:hypothetical protein